MEKEATFKALKKAEFRERLNVIVAAQARQLHAEHVGPQARESTV